MTPHSWEKVIVYDPYLGMSVKMIRCSRCSHLVDHGNLELDGLFSGSRMEDCDEMVIRKVLES